MRSKENIRTYHIIFLRLVMSCRSELAKTICKRRLLFTYEMTSSRFKLSWNFFSNHKMAKILSFFQSIYGLKLWKRSDKTRV